MVEAAMAVAEPNADRLKVYLKDSEEVADEVEDLYKSG
jgi:hypothetical protein